MQPSESTAEYRAHMPEGTQCILNAGYRRAADAYPSIGLQPWISLPSGKEHRK